MGSTTVRRAAKGRIKVLGAITAGALTGAAAFTLGGTAPLLPAGGATARSARHAGDWAPPTPQLLDTVSTAGDGTGLALVTAPGACTPLRDAATGSGSTATASPAAAGRARVSFGGAQGQEPAVNCTSVATLTRMYGEAVDHYAVTAADFDIAGEVLPDVAANSRRAQAVARLQQSHPGLEISFTLPVTPEGLTQPGIDLISDAARHGVELTAVHLVATDRSAPGFGDPGRRYALEAVTATRAQLRTVLGLSAAAARELVALRPPTRIDEAGAEPYTLTASPPGGPAVSLKPLDHYR